MPLRPPRCLATFFAVSFSLRLNWQGGFSDELLDSAVSVPGLALTAASMLAMFAVGMRFDGLKQTLGFLLVSQVIFFFAWQQNRRFPHALAMALNGFTAAKLCLLDPGQNGLIRIFEHDHHAVSPMLLLAAAVFAFDRFAAHRWFYSALSVAAVAQFIWFEAPAGWRLAAWAALSAALWIQRQEREFRYEAWAVGTLVALSGVGWLVGAGGPHHTLAWVAAAVALGWQAWTAFGDAELPERAAALLPLTASSMLCAGALMWHALPSPLVAPAWGLLALAGIEIAAMAGFRELEWCATVGAWAAGGRLRKSSRSRGCGSANSWPMPT